MKPRDLVADAIEDMHQRHRAERKANARNSYEALTGRPAPDRSWLKMACSNCGTEVEQGRRHGFWECLTNIRTQRTAR